ncbi:ElyC/SanA/YdcF family protein [Actinoplanes oblitus]|uniref:ElyC/SanA/YdcF family protein n=1 Tax=Actinoplanes oblitus TaxID=3040509 RepID=A0ABY8WMB5_9ACTN|nr:ElyC/SanA/YdcF family protein [Actinoplanes oblitus]WIM97977.1 ElyC/SanA/YdcF family protein [Actinoplanes oblitus]
MAVALSFEILPGTPGLALAEVAHVLVPGRGRTATGDGLTPEGAARVAVAADLFRTLGADRGVIVCAGYKSPADHKGRPWTTPEAPGEVFCGVPEADLMRDALLASGGDPFLVRAERHSVDTVTNLLHAESHFGDSRPVAIVSQRSHLQRILPIIAPRTLRRPYLGVVVPPLSPGAVPSSMPGVVPPPDSEHFLADLASRVIAARLPADPARAATVATRRAVLLWRLAQALGKREYL